MDREPRAVLLVLGLAILGHAGRLLLGHSRDPPGEILASSRSGADPEVHRARAIALARPLSEGEKIDLNHAPPEEIARLPRIGMSLAKRITSDRASRGPFGGLRDLDRVPGVGPALLGHLADRVVFGGGGAFGGSWGYAANPSTFEGYGTVPGVPTGAPVDLNSASLEDLVALPGIGRARARAILAYRRSHGSFAAVSDLARVPGFSQSLVARVAAFLTAR